MAHGPGKQTFWRTRNVVLNDRDELAFSRVLREFAPGVRMRGPSISGPNGTIVDLPTIAHAGRDHDHPLSSSSVWIGIPLPIHLSSMRINDLGEPIKAPRLDVDDRRSEWEWADPSKKWAFDLPVLEDGKFTVSFPRDCLAFLKFADSIVRLLNNISRRRFGLDAMLWSQAGHDHGERRSLAGSYPIQPDVEVRLNKYYDDDQWEDRLPEKTWDRAYGPPSK